MLFALVDGTVRFTSPTEAVGFNARFEYPLSR